MCHKNLCDYHSSTVAKLSKGQNIQTDALCKICKVLNCDFKDIMEYIPD
ncbi:MAG: helix-turn-helix transcriptional regulator [Bacilli bacterium]|nr:helix-turn-helix transcriptional regulator [Bacilli bacterium]